MAQMTARQVISVVAFTIVGMAHGDGNCGQKSQSTGSFDDAILKVNNLPEFRRWKSEHSFPVAYGMGRDRQELIEGRCFWEVPVYADRPERFEHWETFYVAADSKTVFVFDSARGEPVTLATWRKRTETNDSP